MSLLPALISKAWATAAKASINQDFTKACVPVKLCVTIFKAEITKTATATPASRKFLRCITKAWPGSPCSQLRGLPTSAVDVTTSVVPCRSKCLNQASSSSPFCVCTCLAKSQRLLFLMILLLLVHRAPRGRLRRPGFRSQNGLPGFLLLLLFRALFLLSQHVQQHTAVNAASSQPHGQPRADAFSTTVSHHTEVWPACTAWSPVVLCKLLTPARTHLTCRLLHEEKRQGGPRPHCQCLGRPACRSSK